MQSSSSVGLESPSFDTYSSSNRLATIAARVVNEFQHHSDLDDYLSDHHHHHNNKNFTPRNPRLHLGEDELKKYSDDEDEEEFEFEFASVSREPADLFPIPADEIIYNGQIRPVYPLFNTKLLYDTDKDVQFDRSLNSLASPVRLPLGKLFIQERERDSPSCSSSDADELDNVSPETYCVWKPKSAETLPENREKSSSTGSSKRWKFRDLLHRSNSEGKDSFVFLTSLNKRKNTNKITKSVKEDVKPSGKVNAIAGEMPTTAKENDRRTNIPYNKDIVGMIANVNNVSKNLRPF